MQRYASLRQGLVGCWCPSVSGPFGYRLPDLSGYGNHGTLTNMDPGTDWVTSGGKGALDFDGTDDYTNQGNRVWFGSLPYAVSVWLSTRTLATYQIIIGKDNYPGNRDFVLGVANNSSKLLWGNYLTGVTGTTDLSANKWYHVVFQRRSTAVNDFALFLNGRTEVIGTDGKTYTSNIALMFGKREITADERYFNGQLDDIRIYNRALSESEIRLLASGRGVGLIPERQRNRYLLPSTRNRSSRFLSFPA